jgi:purine-cytosine permease-like protein
VEYYGIAIGLIIILILYFLFNGIDDQKKYSPYVSVVLLILAFEFILIVFDPLLGRLTKNEPVFSFMANVLIALALVPVQQYGERIFNKYAVVVRLKKMEEEKP